MIYVYCLSKVSKGQTNYFLQAVKIPLSLNVKYCLFAAQLALAIMESQRQMMEGGYGNPDGFSSQSPGVTEEGKALWETIVFKSEMHKSGVSKGQYGSVSRVDDDEDLKKPATTLGEEEPHCSICLGEYEEDEKLVKLPCGHIYHNECINSWCSNHTRCPLCNYDLNQINQNATSTTNPGVV
jgi:Ring finger domain